jgi:uncharacterized protein (DUF952 family)
MMLHITSAAEWKAAQERGFYTAPSLETEGFIHCSTEKQVTHVANAFYRGQSGLVLLVIEETRVKPQVKWEAPAGPPANGISQNDLFPHIYGPLNVDAVLKAVEFPSSSDGTFTLPSLN